MTIYHSWLQILRLDIMQRKSQVDLIKGVMAIWAMTLIYRVSCLLVIRVIYLDGLIGRLKRVTFALTFLWS